MPTLQTGKLIVNPIAQAIPLPVVVMAGQSNMSGSNSENTLSAPYTAVMQRALKFMKPVDDISTTNNGQVAGLLAFTNNNYNSSSLASIGPEISMAYDYSSQSASHRIGIIKYSLPNSGLVDDGSIVAPAGLWQKNADATRASNILHYDIFVNRFVIPGLARYRSMGYEPYIAAFCWCQGERDSSFPTTAALYQTTLAQFFTDFKADVSPYDSTITTNLHVIISDTRDNGYSNVNDVNTAKQNYVTALGSYGHMVTVADLPVRVSDGIHITMDGQITHGLRYSAILKTILP